MVVMFLGVGVVVVMFLGLAEAMFFMTGAIHY